MSEDVSAGCMEAEEALEWLRRAVDTQGPEFVYNTQTPGEGCSYLPRTKLPEWDPRSKTGCVVGVAMSLAGRRVTGSMDGDAPATDYLMDVWKISEEAASVLGAAQRVQDDGGTWGAALLAAVERWEEIRVRG